MPALVLDLICHAAIRPIYLLMVSWSSVSRFDNVEFVIWNVHFLESEGKEIRGSPQMRRKPLFHLKAVGVGTFDCLYFMMYVVIKSKQYNIGLALEFPAFCGAPLI